MMNETSAANPPTMDCIEHIVRRVC
ncbi:hypothetical protein EAPG_02294 [Escherichia albertii B156]|nr:hypothetical protein EAPG_02294 [Escherichia albertii B156]